MNNFILAYAKKHRQRKQNIRRDLQEYATRNLEGLQEYARRQAEYEYLKNKLDTEKSKNYKDKDHSSKEKYNKTEKLTTNKLEIKKIVDLS